MPLSIDQEAMRAMREVVAPGVQVEELVFRRL
jgi:hypothetical protein